MLLLLGPRCGGDLRRDVRLSNNTLPVAVSHQTGQWPTYNITDTGPLSFGSVWGAETINDYKCRCSCMIPSAACWMDEGLRKMETDGDQGRQTEIHFAARMPRNPLPGTSNQRGTSLSLPLCYIQYVLPCVVTNCGMETTNSLLYLILCMPRLH